MSFHMIATNDNPDMAALAYGPVVLVGDIGTEGITPPAPYAGNQNEFREFAVPDDVVTSLNTCGKKTDDWLVPVEGKPLVFKTSGVASREITLIPYYQIDKQR
jgi:uncharacterized protein